ncbi:MAG: TIGR00180 family glycosyltransferase, partial [Patescibacteria group bacterium]
MNKSANTPEIGIVVPTMNRPDFVIRQLNYYASLNFPHTIYYSDGSYPENAKKIKEKIDKLKNKLNIVYLVSPAGNSIRSVIQLLSAVQEKYVSFFGDDDYWIPDALNQCVEFLEK